MISSQGVFIRMKWDKMVAKDAALVHLFLNSEVPGLQLPTAWHVHTFLARAKIKTNFRKKEHLTVFNAFE